MWFQNDNGHDKENVIPASILCHPREGGDLLSSSLTG